MIDEDLTRARPGLRARLLAIEHQQIPFRSKPYQVDHTNPLDRYDTDQCVLCGRCVEACQNVS
jgi:formate dehydrogenase major subunit